MSSKTAFKSLVMSVLLLSNCTSQTQNSAHLTDTTAQAKATATGATTDGKFCFLKAENRDTTRVSLLVNGTKVSGEMIWNPYEKDGAVGILTGTKNASGEFELLYDYMIEGNKQTEAKVMKIENSRLLIKTGELEDPKNDGNLRYKDVLKATYAETLQPADCQ